MIYYPTYTQDVIGNNYLALKFDLQTIKPFLEQLKEIIDNDALYDEMTSYQQQRDHDSYHSTIINVMDYNRLSKELGMDKFINSLESVFKYPIDDLKMMGIGTAQKNENQTYFIVLKSEKLESIRKKYNLPEHDFHVTLGFKYKDVFGVRKNTVINKKNKFIKLLKDQFYKFENFNFLKKVQNLDIKTENNIEVIKIDQNSIKIKIEDFYMDISLLDDGRLWVMSKYQDSYIPKMSKSEIIDFFKNN
jgi:hypothetical protein